MSAEVCNECGFNGAEWTDVAALDAIRSLPGEWKDVTAGVHTDDLRRRPIPNQWSIAEYADHVREVLFGMRFVLDSAVEQPGIDLGEPPEPSFAPEPRTIVLAEALAGIAREASALRDRLAELPHEQWSCSAVVGGNEVDVRWISRHAVHDATHHLKDVTRLREVLGY